MNTLLTIYIISAFVTLLGFLWLMVGAATEFYRKNGPAVKMKKSSPAKKITAFLRMFLICLIPLFNLVLFFAIIFSYDTLVDGLVSKLNDDIETEELSNESYY